MQVTMSLQIPPYGSLQSARTERFSLSVCFVESPSVFVSENECINLHCTCEFLWCCMPQYNRNGIEHVCSQKRAYTTVARLSDTERTKVWSVKSAHVFSVSRHWYFMSMHIPSHTHRFGWSQTPHSLKVLSPCQVMSHFNWFMGHLFAVQCRFMCTMKYICVWW